MLWVSFSALLPLFCSVLLFFLVYCTLYCVLCVLQQEGREVKENGIKRGKEWRTGRVLIKGSETFTAQTHRVHTSIHHLVFEWIEEKGRMDELSESRETRRQR